MRKNSSSTQAITNGPPSGGCDRSACSSTPRSLEDGRRQRLDTPLPAVAERRDREPALCHRPPPRVAIVGGIDPDTSARAAGSRCRCSRASVGRVNRQPADDAMTAQFHRVAVLGLGLIGGSLLHAVRQQRARGRRLRHRPGDGRGGERGRLPGRADATRPRCTAPTWSCSRCRCRRCATRCARSRRTSRPDALLTDVGTLKAPGARRGARAASRTPASSAATRSPAPRTAAGPPPTRCCSATRRGR